jgi:hypothetical protein
MFSTKKQRMTMLAGIVVLLGSAVSAHAGSLYFSFDSLAPSAGDNSTNVANYMDGIIGCGTCVTVVGAVTNQTYNGDGHVVGPGTGSTSLTLGNTNGATVSNSGSVLNGSFDTFLSNTTNIAGINHNGVSQISQGFTMTFAAPYALNGYISFDYEIFPDASGTAGNPPDLKFTTFLGGVAQPTVTLLGVVPGTAPIGSTKSPISGSETSPQMIGHYSTGYLTNVTELSFMDWPATIGIDNLAVTPEPRFYGLLLASLLGLAGVYYRNRRAAQSKA